MLHESFIFVNVFSKSNKKCESGTKLLEPKSNAQNNETVYKTR